MINYGSRSISAPQIGYRYRIFAMETVFYEDFDEYEEKTDFEKLFLYKPQNNFEFEKQTEGINSYLKQLEFHLNNHIPYKNDLDLNNYKIKPKIFINPSWSPLDLDQSIFEMEQKQGNLTKLSSQSSSTMYITLLFGCSGIRTSCNYEQCLSFPELMVKKERINRIRVEYWNENGNKKICYLKSHDSRLFQHECDHLDGKLMIDNGHSSVKWNDDINNSVMYIDEYLRRQEILQPQIDNLLNKFGPNEQNELYKIYDPLHPPCDEELIQILEFILKQKNEKQQQIQESINKHNEYNDEHQVLQE